MFNSLNIENPFYINNNFDFDTSSDSDSEEEIDNMSAATNINTAGSTIHKMLIAFFRTNPVPENKLAENTACLEQVYNASEALWTAYKNEVNAYSNDDTEEVRIVKATQIGDAAVAIRNADEQTRLTVIRNAQVEVTLDGLTADEIIALKELHDLVLSKMQGNGVKGSAEKANQMVVEFKNDMELAKIDNTFPTRWLKNHGVWKCCQHELQKGLILNYTYDDAGVVDKAKWKLIVDEFNKHKDNAIPQQGSGLMNSSNKFAVDVYCAAVNRYKNTIEQGKQSFQHFLNSLKLIAAFLNKSSIKKTEWIHFVAANSEYRAFYSGLDDGNFLYDNPGKLTRARLFACASSLFRAPEPIALYCVGERLGTIPKMIVKIYNIEKKFNIIDKTKGTTSTSEHLCHLLLTLGSTNPYVFNRNKIPTSIREVKFNLN